MSEQIVIPIGQIQSPIQHEPWMLRGACRTSPLGPDAWHPGPREGRGPLAQAAKRVCIRECPVARECLLHALARNEPHGIYGGLGPTQRARFVREARERRSSRGTAA